MYRGWVGHRWRWRREQRKLFRKKEIKSEWIFPNFFDYNKPILPSTAYQKLKSILKKAGLPNIRFHDLRHTFATRCIEAGMKPKTLQILLGHSNIGITMNLYVHTTEEEKTKEIDLVAQALMVI